MGGVVSRYVIMLKNSKNTVSTIFTLSTPHIEPPASITYGICKFYRDLNLFWSNSSYFIANNISLVSAAGGTRDTLLDSRLTHIEDITDSSFSLSFYTTGLPGCWASSDHEGMVW